MNQHILQQIAPYPDELETLVKALEYKPNWEFRLTNYERDPQPKSSFGLTLFITIECVDSYHHERKRRVAHLFAVPPATYDVRSWRRWLFERILDVERHEAMEFFTIAGDKPYAPSHGPGNDPYLLREVGTDLDQRTSFRGEVKDCDG